MQRKKLLHVGISYILLIIVISRYHLSMVCRYVSYYVSPFLIVSPFIRSYCSPSSYRYIVVHKRHHLTTSSRADQSDDDADGGRQTTDRHCCMQRRERGRERERRTERLCGQRLTSDWLAQDEKDKNPDEIIIVVIIYVKQCNSGVTMSHKKRMDTRDKRTIILGDILINGGSIDSSFWGIIRYRLCLLYWWCAALLCKSYVFFYLLFYRLLFH